MKVCLVTNEFFHWGNYGGFGAFTNKLAIELKNQGVDVEVVMPFNNPEYPSFGQTKIVDAVSVKGLPKISNIVFHKKRFKTDADVIHSQCDPYTTWFVFRGNTDKPKVVTIQDLRSKSERKKLTCETPGIEFGMPTLKQLPYYPVVWRFYKSNLKKANVVAYHAHLLESKVRAVLGYEGKLLYLPNFVDIPKTEPCKSDRPSVVFLGRLDPIKNPELSFEVARKVPDVDFYVLGQAHNPQQHMMLCEKWKGINNLHLLGHNSKELKEDILNKAWVLINTSLYEAMPVSFLEGLAHKCALLSCENPDNYVDRFGCSVSKLEAPYYVEGLKNLIKNDLWKEQGEKGFAYVKQVHSTKQGVQNHLELYRRLIN